MRFLLTTASALTLFLSCTTAQLLHNSNGQLPACARTCTVLTQAQSSCNGRRSDSLETWKCFCSAVWRNSNEDPTTMCSSECTSPSDNSAVSTWYTANCGSDNGASEHSSSGNTGGSGGSGSSAAPVPSASANAGTGVTTTTGGSSDESSCSGGWWHCHWKWVVMIIVIAIGLIILGFVGRWLKKRHDRKQDMIRGGFNDGITARSASGPLNPNASHPEVTQHGNDSSFISGAAGAESGSGRDSPVRTRDAFMPYGYGYERSQSRLAGTEYVGASPLARGGTPVDEIEKAAETPTANPRSKSRRVLVRERSTGANS